MAPRKIPPDLPPDTIFTVEPGLYVRKTVAGQIRWGISYKYKGRLVRRIVGTNKTVARAALAGVKADIARGKFALAHTTRQTLEQFAPAYLAYAEQHKRSWKRDKVSLAVIGAAFGKKRLDAVSANDIEAFKAARRKTVAPATVNRDIAVLRHLYALAIKWGEVAENPVVGIALYPIGEQPMRVLSVDEELKLVKNAAPHLKPLIMFALNTGLRRGELFALTWADINTKESTVTVVQSKSGRIRHVPLNDVAQDALRRAGWLNGGAVFRYKGNPLTDVKKSFAHAVKLSKIPPCRFHDLRHTFATRLVLAGVDLPTVQELMGHASITTTRRYAHPSPAHRRAAVNRLQLASYNRGVTKVLREPELAPVKAKKKRGN